MDANPWPPSFNELLRAHLPLLHPGEPLTSDLALGEYGLDSLAAVDLLLEMEKRFSVSIPDELLTGSMFTDPAAIWSVLTQLRPDLQKLEL